MKCPRLLLPTDEDGDESANTTPIRSEFASAGKDWNMCLWFSRASENSNEARRLRILTAQLITKPSYFDWMNQPAPGPGPSFYTLLTGARLVLNLSETTGYVTV